MAEYTSFGTVIENVDHKTLYKNKDWLEASLKLYEANHGKLPTEQDLSDRDGETYAQKIADYGLKEMAGFNFNIGDQAIDTYTITQKADQRTKEAFVYLMDQYDNVDSSWHTAGQAGWEMATDFTNWLGLGSLGIGAVAGQAAKFAGKKAVKEALLNNTKKKVQDATVKESLKRSGAIAGVEGALHGVAYDSMQQNVRLDAGAQEEYNTGQTLLSAGIGAAGGVVLGTGIDYAGARLGSKLAKKGFEKRWKAFNDDIDARVKDAEARKKADEPVTTKDTVETTEPKVDAEPQRSTIENPEGKPKLKEGISSNSGFILVEGANKELQTVKLDTELLADAIETEGVSALERLMRELETRELTQAGWETVKENANVLTGRFLDEEAMILKGLQEPDLPPAARQSLLDALQRNDANLNLATAATENVNSYSGRALELAKRSKRVKPLLGGDESDEVLRLAKKRTLQAERNHIENQYNQKIQKHLDENTSEGTNKAIELTRQKHDELTAIDVQTQDVLTNYDKFNKQVEKYVELSISGVFSPATVVINTVWPTIKTYTYPMLDQIIANPMSLEKWRRTMRVYSHMFAATAAARKSFVSAWELEQTTLTADFNRMYDGGIKVKGRVAAGARTFPRLLGATDAYVQEVAAAGYLAGDAIDGLVTEGIEQGLRGKKLKKFIDNNIESRIRDGYNYDLDAAKLKPIYEKGRDGLKLEGEELDKYVLKQVKRMGKDGLKTLGNKKEVATLHAEADRLFKLGTEASKKEAATLRKRADRLDKTADASLEYVQTLLYKKEFQKGKTGIAGWAEGRAKWLEDVHRSHPIAKLFGNLFFRTPAWVFQESLRLTPLINTLMPQFRNDLGGANGIRRQARAQTEMAMGMTLMMYVTTKWAQGEITGSTNKDFTMIGEQEVSGLGGLQIQLGDEGKVFDYRRYEPLRIPMTIWVNALDGYMAKRDSQNRQEMEDTLTVEMKHHLGVAMATLLSAFKDSGLFTGIVDTFKAGAKTTGALSSDDPDSRENAYNIMGDLAMKKLLMPVPSTIKKTQTVLGGGEMIAPVNAQQRALATLVPQAASIPRKYDIFGNVRKIDQPLSAFNPFYFTTPEQRKAGRSDKEMFVHDWINELEQQGFGNFTRSKFNSSNFPENDLREVMTTYDGIEMSVYDAMMVELNKNKKPLVEKLYRLAQSPLSLGSPFDPRFNGEPVKKARSEIRNAKTEALERVIGNDKTLRDRIQYDKMRQKKAQRGDFISLIQPTE